MFTYSTEMSIISLIDDRVPDGQMCHTHHHPNDNNIPTTLDQGKINCQINIINFLIHVLRINMVTDTYLS